MNVCPGCNQRGTVVEQVFMVRAESLTDVRTFTVLRCSECDFSCVHVHV